MFARGFGIGGENGDEEYDQADSGESAGARGQEADGAGDFAEAGEINHGHGRGNLRWNHGGHVVAQFREMGDAGGEEHDGDGAADRGEPGVEIGGAEKAGGTEGECGNEEHDQDGHEHDCIAGAVPWGGGGWQAQFLRGFGVLKRWWC
jgi:hypothetical protein